MWSTTVYAIGLQASTNVYPGEKNILYKKFRFDKRWLSKPNFEQVVIEGWSMVRNLTAPMVVNTLHTVGFDLPMAKKGST